MKIHPLERVSSRHLTMVDFLRHFWVPEKPFILVDAAEHMPAWGKWCFDYLRKTADPSQACSSWRQSEEGSEKTDTTVGEALAQLRSRQEAGTDDGVHCYVRDWSFGAANPALLQDIKPPIYFSQDLTPLVQEGMFKWLYIGEKGSYSETHIDVANTSAWLLLFEGKKHWRMAGSKYLPRFSNADKKLIDLDLFARDLGAVPEMDDVEIFDGIQNAGEIVWNPSRLIHGVRNLTFTTSVTYNYVDLTNLPQVYDAVSKNRDLLGQIPTPPAELAHMMAQAGRARIEQLGDKEAAEILCDSIRREFGRRELRCDW